MTGDRGANGGRLAAPRDPAARRMSDFPIEAVRSLFPALSLEVGGAPAVFFDGPGGTQVPASVIDAMGDYLRTSNANRDPAFLTGERTERLMATAHARAAGLLGCEPGETVFGQNMTTLAFGLSHALSRNWGPGDEIVVTNLDHAANVDPWVRAAERVGATVRRWDIDPATCTLPLEQLEAVLSDRTKFLAVGLASNAVGTINPVREACERARAVGAMTFADAVHAGPHLPIDAAELGCDFLACSPYKFFGPHLGLLFGRRELLEKLDPDHVRPTAGKNPLRWMTGTQNHEGIAGFVACCDYLASLRPGAAPGEPFGGNDAAFRPALLAAFGQIREYESALGERLLRGLAELPDVRVRGLTRENGPGDALWERRVTTFALTHARRTPRAMQAALAAEGFFTYAGNFYALPLTERLGIEPEGLLRVGLVHYNTAAEVDRLVAALGRF